MRSAAPPRRSKAAVLEAQASYIGDLVASPRRLDDHQDPANKNLSAQPEQRINLA